MTEDLEELARQWWEARRLANGTRDERKRWSLDEPADVAAAWEAVREIVDRGGQRALDLVVALLDAAPDDSGPSIVGAGPLEDIVAAHGHEFSIQLDELSRTSREFGDALSAVWLDAHAMDVAARAVPQRSTATGPMLSGSNRRSSR